MWTRARANYWLWLWKQEGPDRSPEAFIFPNARKRNGAKRNGFIRRDNYRARVLRTLAAKLGLAKLNFQVLRRTMATPAQTKGGVKDVQGVLGHSKADTTVNVYMQQIEAGVKSTLDAIHSELTARGGSGRLVKFRQRFGRVWYGGNFGWSASDRIVSVGRLTQR
jgi:integrase